MVFRGTYDHTFDTKNRLTIPSKLRSQLAESVVVSMATDQRPCLTVSRPEDHESRTEDTLSRFPALSTQAAELRRYLYGNSHATEVDSAGRVMVPSWMTERTGLGRDVVIVGAGDCFEVWNRTDWSGHNDNLGTSAAEIIASLGHPA